MTENPFLCLPVSCYPSLPHCSPAKPENALSDFTSFPVCVLSRLPHYPLAPGCHYHVLGTLLFWGLNSQSTGVCCWRIREKGAVGIRAGPATEACHPSPTFSSGMGCCSQFLPFSSYHCPPTGDGHRALSFFHQKGLRDFDTLLLSADGNTLYVGAREAVLALNIQSPGIPQLRNMVRSLEPRV